ncbi:MAG: cell division/cell wall cluster transcriptional repressor MraZ [Actinomycetota bacterium]|nr:cell division/cell wall cluster transcriptional repressor MraZ [Actinomycetota bacterium]
MALGFFGRYEHSLDLKGRIILPARFRGQFDTSAYITRHLEGCLALWTPAEFEKQTAEMLGRQERGAEDRNNVRIWAGTSAAVEIDRQGRVAVPKALQDFAGLDRAVLVMGALDRIELWNPALWDVEVKPAERTFMGGSGQTVPSSPSSQATPEA